MENNQSWKDSSGQKWTARVWFTGTFNEPVYVPNRLAMDNYGIVSERVRHEAMAFDDWRNVEHEVKTVYSITDYRAFCIRLAIKAQDRSFGTNPDGSITFGKYGPKWTV